jgi:hypothetical protein
MAGGFGKRGEAVLSVVDGEMAFRSPTRSGGEMWDGQRKH